MLQRKEESQKRKKSSSAQKVSCWSDIWSLKQKSLIGWRWPVSLSSKVANNLSDSHLLWIHHWNGSLSNQTLSQAFMLQKKKIKERNLSELMLHKLVFLFIFRLLSSSLLGFQRCLHPPQYRRKHFIFSYILLYLCIYHVSLLIILKKNVLSVTKNIPLEDYLAIISCQTL